MGTWAAPQTKKQAEELAILMCQPLSAGKALNELYPIMGDDDLYTRISDHDDSMDIRWAIAYRLKQFLEMRDTFVKPWQKSAIKICERIVKQYY